MVWRCVLLGAMLAVSSLPAGADDWPQFRGPGRDNKVTGFTAPATWPKELKQVWKVSVGNGVGSPVLADGKLYTFTRVGGDETIRCLDANTGKEIWADKYSVADVKLSGDSGYPGPRNSPVVGEGKVCTFGIGGRLSCYDAASGKLAWRHDTKGTPMFRTSTSPLIAEGKCILHTGKGSGFGKGGAKGTPGKGDLVAYDLSSGTETWKLEGEGPGYGSPVLATIHGVKQVVEQADESLLGVALADGKLLWKTPLQVGRYQTGTPIVSGNVVICAGTAFAIEKSGDTFVAKQLWRERPPATYNTPVLKDGVLYGLAGEVAKGGAGGKGGGGKGGGRATKLFAQDAKSGEVLWTDNAPRGECGAVLDAGSVMLLLSSDSNLVAFKPDRDEFKEVAKYKVADSPTWAMPIIAGKRIYVKDSDSLILLTLE